MIPMETENDDKDSILVDIPIEINTVINDNNIVIDNNNKKQKQKKTFSDELMAKYMQEMYDLIDQDELPVYFPSEGTTPRSTFRFYKNDIREEKEEEEEVITYVDADELGFFIPSEGTVPRSTYVKSSELDEINDVESDELDDYNDSAILSSPVRNEALTIMIKPTLQLKDLN